MLSNRMLCAFFRINLSLFSANFVILNDNLVSSFDDFITSFRQFCRFTKKQEEIINHLNLPYETFCNILFIAPNGM